MSLRVAANISLLFPELPFLDRIGAAADAGFDGVEILFPYDEPAAEITSRLRAYGMPLALINCPPPNYTGGPRGFAAMPELKDRFRRDFERSLRYARELGAERIHVMAGEAEGPDATATFTENLAWASDRAGDMRLTIEPLNPTDMPGYFLNDFQQAADILDVVDAPNLGFQFDAYHAAMIYEEVLPLWDRFGHRAAHVQVGSAPGRHEPDTEELRQFFQRLRDGDYTGWISAEYKPRGDTLAGLDWKKWLAPDGS